MIRNAKEYQCEAERERSETLQSMTVADAIVFVSSSEAAALIGRAVDAGFEVDAAVEQKRLTTTGTMRFRRGRLQIDHNRLQRVIARGA